MVSIIIPVYNGSKFVEKTILSALNQNIDKEVIAIDDCSSDNSYEILLSLANEHKELKLIKNSINLGTCKSVRKGIDNSSGEYIVLLGHDDCIPSYHCQKMLEKFDNDTSLVFCDYDLIDENDNIFDTSNHCKHKNKTIKNFYKGNTVPSVGLVMNKQKLIEAGGYYDNELLPCEGEYHTWIRMAFCGKIVFCDATRSQYRRHSTNITNTWGDPEKIKKLNKYFIICKKQILNSPKVGLLDKAFILYYILYKTIKSKLQ